MNVFVTGATGFCRFSRCSGANQIRPSGARTGALRCGRQVSYRRWRPCDLEDLESLRSGEGVPRRLCRPIPIAGELSDAGGFRGRAATGLIY